jgi:hypothetical protein
VSATGEVIVGSDGALWFNESTYDVTGATPSRFAIGRMTTSGVVTVFPVHTFPAGLVLGPDGSVWFTHSGSCSWVEGQGVVCTTRGIGRLTTTGELTSFPVTGGRAGQMVVGNDGALWFTYRADNTGPEIPTGTIGRTTMDGAVTTFPFPASREVRSITVGPGGSLWFTFVDKGAIATSVGRISYAGAIVKVADLFAVVDADLVLASDGSLWTFGSGPSGSSAIRVAPDGSDDYLPVGRAASDAAIGADGALWGTVPGEAVPATDWRADHGGIIRVQVLPPTVVLAEGVTTTSPSVAPAVPTAAGPVRAQPSFTG